MKDAGVKRLLDVRLHNSSQLAGFAKQGDLAYFLSELCGIDYAHEPLLTPTQALIDAYKKHGGSWAEYERGFLALLSERQAEVRMDRAQFAVSDCPAVQ